MTLVKTAKNRPFFSRFLHRLKLLTLNFNAPLFLQKTFANHSFRFNNVYLHVYCRPSKFVGLVAKHPVCIYSKVLFKIFILTTNNKNVPLFDLIPRHYFVFKLKNKYFVFTLIWLIKPQTFYDWFNCRWKKGIPKTRFFSLYLEWYKGSNLIFISMYFI